VRLRGRTALGATSFVILADYADRLHEAGGRLYLSGVDPVLLDQFRQAQRVDVEGRVQVFVASEVIGDSSGRAYAEAENWLRTAEKIR
jgi:SulP family sulfate permease